MNIDVVKRQFITYILTLSKIMLLQKIDILGIQVILKIVI